MNFTEMMARIKTYSNEELSWILDDMANACGVGSSAYCEVKAEIFRRLREATEKLNEKEAD